MTNLVHAKYDEKLDQIDDPNFSYKQKRNLIKQAIEAAVGNANLTPWTKAPDWVTATLYQGGAIVRSTTAGSTNNLYLCLGSTTITGFQLNLGHGTSGATSPAGTSGAFITDGTVVWIYLGQGTSTGTYPLYSSVTPALPTDVMTGYLSYVPQANVAAMGLTKQYIRSLATPIAQLANVNSINNFDTVPKNSGTPAAPNRPTSSLRPVARIETNASKWLAVGEVVLFDGGGTIKGIKVNGKWLSEAQFQYTGALLNPGSLILNLTGFPSGNKVIEFFSYDTLATCMYSMYVGANEVIYPYVPPNNIRAALEGDSICEIAGSASMLINYRHEILLGEQLGIYNIYNNAMGGTALISNNGGTATTYIQRLADIVAFQPDLLIILGDHNDVDSTTVNSSTRKVAMLTYLQAVRAALPDCLICIFGANLLGAESAATQLVIEQDWIATVAQFKDGNTFVIPVLTVTPQLINSANDLQFRTDGAAPYATGNGYSHPTPWYYLHIVPLIVSGIKKFLTVQ